MNISADSARFTCRKMFSDKRYILLALGAAAPCRQPSQSNLFPKKIRFKVAQLSVASAGARQKLAKTSSAWGPRDRRSYQEPPTPGPQALPPAPGRKAARWPLDPPVQKRAESSPLTRAADLKIRQVRPQHFRMRMTSLRKLYHFCCSVGAPGQLSSKMKWPSLFGPLAATCLSAIFSPSSHPPAPDLCDVLALSPEGRWCGYCSFESGPPPR